MSNIVVKTCLQCKRVLPSNRVGHLCMQCSESILDWRNSDVTVRADGTNDNVGVVVQGSTDGHTWNNTDVQPVRLVTDHVIPIDSMGHMLIDPSIVERLIRIEQMLNELLSYTYGMRDE